MLTSSTLKQRITRRFRDCADSRGAQQRRFGGPATSITADNRTTDRHDSTIITPRECPKSRNCPRAIRKSQPMRKTVTFLLLGLFSSLVVIPVQTAGATGGYVDVPEGAYYADAAD